MNDTKFEIQAIKPKKEELNKSELNPKSEALLKNTNDNININKEYHKTKTEILYSYIFFFINIINIYLFNRRENKGISAKLDDRQIKMKINKNVFLEYKNMQRNDLNYKGKEVNIKKFNNKINRFNIKMYKHIIIMILFNLIISNRNMIEYKFSNITLKVQGPGYSNILNEAFCTHYKPNIIIINENQNLPITHQYNFPKINNTVNLIWNNSIDNCENMFYQCNNITELIYLILILQLLQIWVLCFLVVPVYLL